MVWGLAFTLALCNMVYRFVKWEKSYEKWRAL